MDRAQDNDYGLEENYDDSYNALLDKEHQNDVNLYTENARLQKLCKRLRNALYCISTLFTFAMVGFMTCVFVLRTQNDSKGVLSPVPPMPIKPVKFEANELFAGSGSPEMDEAWAGLVPSGEGLILVNKPNKYNLPPGLHLPKGQLYEISLFHQLHCLNALRTHMFPSQKPSGYNHSNQIPSSLLEKHVHHCLDYIRQALMCAGDMTVEWPRVEYDGNGRQEVIDGYGITHQCKDWDSIADFMKDHNGWLHD